MLFFPQQSEQRIRKAPILTLLLTLVVFLAACSKTQPGETSDPQLKPIQEMLQQQLPIGTTDASVQSFLAARGYSLETPTKPGTVVATIRHIDTETVQPVTARVIFYFDANGKLNTYEIHRIFNQRVP
jgi:multidrug efflux pump subunit AcrA (membrane-fusion protein)